MTTDELVAALRNQNVCIPLRVGREAADQLSALAAVVAAVHTALDLLEADRNGRAMVGDGRAALKCVSAIAKAVER